MADRDDVRRIALDETNGEAPMRSPAATTIEFGFSATA